MQDLQNDNRAVCGIREYVQVNFGDYSSRFVKAKADTGAQSCSVGVLWLDVNREEKTVSFVLDKQLDPKGFVWKLPYEKRRRVKNSNKTSRRYFVKMHLKINDIDYHGLVNLAFRENMQYPILLGCDFFRQQHLLVDPAKKYLLGKPKEAKKLKVKPFLVILSTADSRRQFSNAALIHAAREAGFKVQRVNYKRCVFHAKTQQMFYQHNGCEQMRLLRPDVVLPRATSEGAVSVLRSFELQDATVLNSACSVVTANSKIETQAVLEDLVRFPKAVASQHLMDGYANVMIEKIIGEAPYVLKADNGSGGCSVWKVDGVEQLMEKADRLDSYVIQEFISCDGNASDYRVHAVDGNVIGAMRRVAASETEFRANVKQGGKVEAVTLTQAETAACERAAKFLLEEYQMYYVAFDFMRDNNNEEPVFLEINASPGLRGMCEATGINVATFVIEAARKLINK